MNMGVRGLRSRDFRTPALGFDSRHVHSQTQPGSARTARSCAMTEAKELPTLRFVGERSEQAWREAEAQDALKPGTEGWWKVWGARPMDVRDGDMVLWQDAEGQEVMLVEGTFKSKAWPMRQGWIVNGEQVTFGSLAQIVLLRRTDRNTLAGSI